MASESARLAAKQNMGDEDAQFKEQLECLNDRRHLVPSFRPTVPFPCGHFIYTIYVQWHTFVPADEGVIKVGNWLADAGRHQHQGRGWVCLWCCAGAGLH